MELLGAALCFLALFGGYAALVIAVGYILLCEQDDWVRKTAVKVFAICLCFSVCFVFTDILSELVGFLEGALGLLLHASRLSVVHGLIGTLEAAIRVIRDVLLLMMGFLAFRHASISLPVVDRLADACVGEAQLPGMWSPHAAGRVCESCGKALGQDVLFCPECGARNEVHR